MKRSIIIISIVGIILGIIGFILSYFIHNATTIGLIQHISSCFIEISIGIIIVNIYLERKSKQGAVYSILEFADTSILQFHNKLLDFMWTKFGSNEWANLIQEYYDGDSKPEIIPPVTRENIYEIIKINYVELRSDIRSLESTLTEMTYLIGWNLDAELLKWTIDARNSITKYLQVPNDDSAESKLHAIEYLLDLDYVVGLIRGLLIKLADVKDED
jgi:hypothetical protein